MCTVCKPKYSPFCRWCLEHNDNAPYIFCKQCWRFAAELRERAGLPALPEPKPIPEEPDD